jgi:hypothetical protein
MLNRFAVSSLLGLDQSQVRKRLGIRRILLRQRSPSLLGFSESSLTLKRESHLARVGLRYSMNRRCCKKAGDPGQRLQVT